MEILHALTEMASVAHGGCIFCSNKGSGELIKSAPDISSQITQNFESYRAKRANKFIAYFQNKYAIIIYCSNPEGLSLVFADCIRVLFVLSRYSFR